MSHSNARNQHSRPSILLVEDEQFVREATCRILESLGFLVLSAGDAVDAVRIYERCEKPIDLLMTDMVLSGASGQQLAKDIRQRCARIKVLVTSGYGNAEYDTEDPSAHTYFLAKPYSRRTLLKKIETILGPLAWLHEVA